MTSLLREKHAWSICFDCGVLWRFFFKITIKGTRFVHVREGEGARLDTSVLTRTRGSAKENKKKKTVMCDCRRNVKNG